MTQAVGVIGDVHGEAVAFEKLVEDLLADGLALVSVGDFGDRGPDSATVYRRVLQLADDGLLQAVTSNHGYALARKAGRHLQAGRTAQEIAALLTEQAANDPRQGMTAFVAETVRQIAAEPDGDRLLRRAVTLEQSLPHQLLLQDGRLLVVHGGVEPGLVGDDGPRAVKIARFGTPRGTGEDGLPLDRDSWVTGYEAAALEDPDLPTVVYGHVDYDEPRIGRRVHGIDTGAGKREGGKLTAVIIEAGEVIEWRSQPTR